MSYESDEISIQDSQPIELYIFSYNGIYYNYTSSRYTQTRVYGGTTFVFEPEYIRRGDNLKLGDSSGTIETCTITVGRTNPVALLYQGAPPELGAVNVQIYRTHGDAISGEYIKILDGIVSSVKFDGSDAELTITIENVLNRLIPRGQLSYYCQNCIYDDKCNLDRDTWGVFAWADGGFSGLWIYSSVAGTYPDDYFTDGYIKIGNCYRGIYSHKGTGIGLKYPIPPSEVQNNFTLYPGCSGLFTLCATKFGNTENFSGIPYMQPYDAFKHPVNKGAYWVNSDVIVRDTNGHIGNMGL